MHLNETETKTQQEAGRQPPRTPAAPPAPLSRARKDLNSQGIRPNSWRFSLMIRLKPSKNQPGQPFSLSKKVRTSCSRSRQKKKAIIPLPRLPFYSVLIDIFRDARFLIYEAMGHILLAYCKHG